MLNCKTIDIVTRKIGNNYYDIICDDNGIFKDVPIPSAIDLNHKTALVGNLIIVGLPNDDGDLQGIPKEQIKEVLDNIKMFILFNGETIKQIYNVLKLNQ